MDEYLVPTGFGEDEFIEKKSRFIGRAWLVETEEAALEKIAAMKKQHYDATHNCWAYIIKDGPMRFSDDGEPGGTAGNPMMQVLQREQLYNVVCVVTRYFGGILLGAGGLLGMGQALLCGEGKPFYSFFEALCYTFAGIIAHAKVVLRSCKARFRSLGKRR